MLDLEDYRVCIEALEQRVLREFIETYNSGLIPEVTRSKLVYKGVIMNLKLTVVSTEDEQTKN